MNRLARAVMDQGVEVTGEERDTHDIALHLVKIRTKSSASHVVRLDGVYHNAAQDYKKRNAEIKKHVHRAHGVVYQGEFSQQIATRYLGEVGVPTSAIPNGADPLFYDDLDPWETEFTHNFVAVSRWRPHKRLGDIVKSFLLADIPDSCLWVVGDLKDSGFGWKRYRDNSKLRFLGYLDQKSIGSLYRSCRASLHLCWIDCCPNSVIESLAAGTPVICNNIGGTPALVRKAGGIICDIDAPYDLRPVKLYKPPGIDREIVAQAFHTVIEEKIDVNRKRVSIHHTASAYIELFNKVLQRGM